VGRRARRKGVTGAALRGARRLMEGRERVAGQVAMDIYNVTREAPEGDPLPMEMRGPLTYVGLRAVPAIAAQHGLKVEDDSKLAADIVEYLTEAWVQTFVGFSPEHFAAWREAMDREEAALAAECALCQKPIGEHRLDEMGRRWCEDGSLAANPLDMISDEMPLPSGCQACDAKPGQPHEAGCPLAGDDLES